MAPNNNAPPLRILHYVDQLRLEAGGVVRAVLDLVDALAQSGVRITLLTGDVSDVPDSWNDPQSCVQVVKIDRTLLPWQRSATEKQQLADALAETDVVHLHTPWDPYNLVVAAAARRAGKPYVVSTHGMLDDWCMAQRHTKKRLYLGVVGRRMLEQAAALHFTAEGEQTQSIGWAPGAKPHVLPLVLDLSAYERLPGAALGLEQFSTPEDEPRLLFLSRVNYKKGVDLLIEVVAKLAEQGKPMHALVAGPADPGYQEQLEALTERLGVASRIHFVGMVRDTLKLSLYESADLFVLPTSQENFGIVFAEALACRLPVVTTHGVDIWPELQRMGGTIVERSPEAFAEAIASLLADPGALAERGEQGRQGTLQWLDADCLVQKYVDLYRTC